jgi:Flp pilus assembly pilin Flp
VVLPSRSSHRSERGQALVEYAVIVALIGACLVAILGLVGRSTRRAYEQTASSVSRASVAGYGSRGGGSAIPIGAPTGRPHVDPSAGETPSDSSGTAGSGDPGAGPPVATR